MTARVHGSFGGGSRSRRQKPYGKDLVERKCFNQKYSGCQEEIQGSMLSSEAGFHLSSQPLLSSHCWTLSPHLYVHLCGEPFKKTQVGLPWWHSG